MQKVSATVYGVNFQGKKLLLRKIFAIDQLCLGYTTTIWSELVTLYFYELTMNVFKQLHTIIALDKQK